MKIHLPHGAFLGNIDQFLQGFERGLKVSDDDEVLKNATISDVL